MNDLPRQTQMLQMFLNTKSQHANPEIVWNRFSTFMQLLTITNSHVSLEITLKSISCAMCPGKATAASGLVALTCCQGSVCSRECFRKYVHGTTNGTLLNLESVLCPRCQNFLGKHQCLSYFTEWEIYTCNQKALRGPQPAASASDSTFKCLVHYDDMPMSELVPLDCKHSVCKECAQSHIEAKIEDGRGEIACPINDCTTLITDNLVRSLTPKLYDRYQKLSFEGSKGNMTSEKEILFECPSVNCPNMIIIPTNIFTYTCEMCHSTYCPQCKYVVHPNQTCAQYFEFLQAEQRRKQQNSADEQSTEAFFRGQPGNKFRQCPKCKVWIERADGCKYMSCQSKTCQGKTYFCITCGKKLEQDHGEHKCQVEGYDYL